MDEIFVFILVMMGICMAAILIGGGIDADSAKQNHQDSIACVKAGGTWDTKHDACVNK